MQQVLPDKAQVVVVGGGVVGCSVAYHLAHLGIRDVLVLERDQLTSGTTWHAAGAVGSVKGSVALTKLTHYATELFSQLEQETGQATGFKVTGAISLAENGDRLIELKRLANIAHLAGVGGNVVTPDEIKSLCPMLEVGDLVGGLWTPQEGQTNPTDTTMALAKGARAQGAKIVEGVPVQRIQTDGGRIRGVVTEFGSVQCESLVLCTGMWSRHLARQIGISVPLQAVEHMYVVTEPMPEMTSEFPFVRDFGASVYIKGDAGKLLIGAVEVGAKPWALAGVPDGASFTQFNEDWDHFGTYLESAIARIPALEHAGIRQFLNGPESFTADTRHILGEVPQVKQLYVAAGFNTQGIMSAPGAGKAIAEWISAGEPSLDLAGLEPGRFEAYQASDTFMGARVGEAVGQAFAMHWPYLQHQSARNIKRSPCHEQFAALGACFGVTAGWERPVWYAGPGEAAVHDYSYGAQSWWPNATREAQATAQAVALYELTPFAQFQLEGPDAELVLQRLCTNDIAVEPGRVVYTQLLNELAGIECDLTVTRISETRFWIVTGAAARTHDFHWIKGHMTPDTRAHLVDVSSQYAVMGLMGPRSRALLQAISDDDFSNDQFPFASSREIDLSYTRAWATRVSFVGELGWEIYLPMESAVGVVETLLTMDEFLRPTPAGLYCLDACRLEKGFRHLGHELSIKTSPLETGLMFAASLDKPGGFLGREALLRKRDIGVTHRIVQFTLESTEVLLLHEEPIYRDGKLVGETTSGGFGHRIGQPVCLGFVSTPATNYRDYLESGTFEIDVAGVRYPATPHLRPVYDPTGQRMRS